MKRKGRVAGRKAGERRVSLPVIGAPPGRAAGDPRKVRPSRMARWRALVLLLVHVVIAVHIVQWLVTGLTVSPVEPSESMYTLERGALNAGFIFFLLAIASTLIFGRFFCGWGCHVIALQDLCSAGMRRVGIHPRAFRSRLLVLVPLGLGLYMFVWPTFKLHALTPLLDLAGTDWPGWLRPVERFDRVTNDLIVEDFWATFPPWYVAIPFLAVCGFGAVYFLGSKGFCTYGCPYGGLFRPADRVAPVRIRVTDACEGCGHCTAACTSNVRVHEEVRDFGMVVDPGCMKCMDCVSVCPKDALYVGLGRPALLAPPRSDAARETARAAKAKRRRRYDLTLGEEFAVAGIFLALFVSFRGMLDLIPMLMAAAMAGIGAFCAWKLWRLLREPSVRLQHAQLKHKGRWRPAGVVFAVLTVASLLAAAWGGQANANRWWGNTLYAGIDVPAEAAQRPEFALSPGMRERAESALAAYGRADAPEHGGFGWRLNADLLVRVAYLHSLLGRHAEAEAAMREIVERGRPRDHLVFDLLRTMRARGAAAGEIEAVLEHALELHPDLHDVRAELARMKHASGRSVEASALWEEGEGAAWLIARASFEAARGRSGRAAEMLDEAGAAARSMRRGGAERMLTAAERAAGLGRRDLVERLLADALERDGEDVDVLVRASQLSMALGDPARARLLAWEAVERDRRGRASVRLNAGRLALAIGEGDEARAMFSLAAAQVDRRPWELAAVGVGAVREGLSAQDDQLTSMGRSWLVRASESASGEATLRHDVALGMLMLGEADNAVRWMLEAAELGVGSAELALRAAQLLQEAGRRDEADHWRREAARRASGSN